MTDTTIHETAKVEITFSLADFVRHYYGDDDEPMRSNLMTTAAELLIRDIRDDVRQAVAEQVKAQVGDVVRETLENGVRKTNTWGEPTGEVTTLRDMIAAEANAFLTKSVSRGYNNGSETQVQAYIRESVDRQIKKELQAAVDSAKKQVTAAVKDQAAQVITETVARMGGIR